MNASESSLINTPLYDIWIGHQPLESLNRIIEEIDYEIGQLYDINIKQGEIPSEDTVEEEILLKFKKFLITQEIKLRWTVTPGQEITE